MVFSFLIINISNLIAFEDKAPAGTVYGIDNKTKVPLAPGIPFYIDSPEELQKWSKNNLPIPKGIVSLYVPIFSQNNFTWKNNKMKTCNLTIGGYGCALTSSAMVFKYYGATKQNPGQLNMCLDKNACPLYWSIAANSCSEKKVTYVGAWTFSYKKLYDMLSISRPPIIKIIKSNNSHFVVIISGSGNQPKDYWINDPWDGKSKQLSAYTNNGWTPNAIYEFSKQ